MFISISNPAPSGPAIPASDNPAPSRPTTPASDNPAPATSLSQANIFARRVKICQAIDDFNAANDLLKKAASFPIGLIKSYITNTEKISIQPSPAKYGDLCNYPKNLSQNEYLQQVSSFRLSENSIQEVEQNATSYRDVLGKFLLPLLYGTLGSLALLVRELSSSIREIRFSRVFRLEYGMQVPLGALIGATIGLVITPTTLSNIGGVTSLGIAFAFGYSVDVFFAFLDNVVKRLTQTPSSTP